MNNRLNWEEFGKIATILGFIADCIALSLLLVSSFPESGAVDNDIWIVFQYTILFLGMIGYLGYLRQIWRENLKNNGISFLQYLVDLLNLDDWVKLIPPLVLSSFLVVISLQVNAFVNTLIWGILISGVIIVHSAIKREKEQTKKISDAQRKKEKEREIRQSNKRRAQETFEEWIPRIDKTLENKGYMTSWEMSQNYNENEDYCTLILRYYYQTFIDDKDLISPEGRYNSYVVAYRHLAETKPWY